MKKILIYLLLWLCSGIAYILFDIWFYLMNPTLIEKVMTLMLFIIAWIALSIIGAIYLHEIYIEYKKKENNE